MSVSLFGNKDCFLNCAFFPVLGMAIYAYGYDPDTEKRQTATGDNKDGISAKIKTRGISVSNDTILRYLTEAKDLL